MQFRNMQAFLEKILVILLSKTVKLPSTVNLMANKFFKILSSRIYLQLIKNLEKEKGKDDPCLFL